MTGRFDYSASSSATRVMAQPCLVRLPVRSVAWFCGAACSVLLAAGQTGQLVSGPAVGEKVASFYVRAITGPLRNKSVCYVCRNGDRPVVMLFAREDSPALRRLLKDLDTQVEAHRAQGLRAFCVFLPREGKDLLPAVQTLAFDEKVSLPLTIAAAAVEGPAGQNLHPQASITAVLYREQVVVARFAWRSGEEIGDQAARFTRAVAELAGSE